MFCFRVSLLVLFIGIVSQLASTEEVDDDKKLDEFINALPDKVFDDKFDGDTDEFNSKVDELFKDYVSKMDNKKLKDEREENKESKETSSTSQKESEKLNTATTDDEEKNKNSNIETPEKPDDQSEEVDNRPVMDVNADPSTFYPIMSDEEFAEQEKKDLEEQMKRDEPEPRVVEDEATIQRYIDDAFKAQSFDQNPLVVESDYEEAKRRDEIRSDQWPEPGKEYTGSDIVEIPNDEEFTNYHQMTSMGQIDDPFKTSFEDYDAERKARSLADMELDLYE